MVTESHPTDNKKSLNNMLLLLLSFAVLKASQGIYLAFSSCVFSSTVHGSLKFDRGILNAEHFVVKFGTLDV